MILRQRAIAAQLTTALAFGQESLGDGEKGQIVFRLLKAMAFIRVEHVGYRYILGLHGLDDLVRFGLLYTGIVGTLPDQ